MSVPVALITGGASGLGRALAFAYGRAGYSLMLGDVNEEALTDTSLQLMQQGFSVSVQTCDVRDEAQLNQLLSAAISCFGKVDIFVNNAGVAAYGPIDEVDGTDWRWLIDINLLGVVQGCRVATTYFKKQGRGTIVNIASLAGLVNMPEMSAYNAVKAAVVSLSETLRIELAAFGIAVHVVCPGFFKTALGRSLRTRDRQAGQFLERLMSASPLSADDVAAVIIKETAAGGFYICPHRSERKWWWLKRYWPALYFYLMTKMGAKAAQRHQRVRA